MITVCPNTAGHAMHLQKYVDKRIYDGHLRFGLDDLVGYHRQGGMEPLRASHLGLMSLNNLDFSGYGRAGGLLKMLVKLVNGPLVALLYPLKKLGLPSGDPRLSAALIVVARKPAAAEATAAGAGIDHSNGDRVARSHRSRTEVSGPFECRRHLPTERSLSLAPSRQRAAASIDVTLVSADDTPHREGPTRIVLERSALRSSAGLAA